MNRFIHLIQVPFVGVGIRPYRGDDWYRHRVNIFKKYTLNSLLNQTNRQFILWLSFIPELKNHPVTIELKQFLKEKGVIAFMTFDGLMYHDDKFNKGFKEKLMNLARLIRMAYDSPKPVHTIGSLIKLILTNKPPLGFGWKQALKTLFEDKNGTLKDRLNLSLKHIKDNLKTGQFEWVYVTRIDSDDMFHQDFVTDVQLFPPFPGALTCRDGYVYNSNTGQLSEWNPKTSPPFHTIIFSKENFFDSARYIQYFKGFRSHEDIPNVFNSQNIKGRKYCVLIHKQHISTIWEHPWKGKEVEDKKDILNEFGIGSGHYFKLDGHKISRPSKDEKNLAIKEIISDYSVYKSENKIYEPETTKIIKETVKEGDICVDVGASIGYMTMQLARQTGKTGLVYAFEPTANQFPYLQRNIAINGYADRVKPFNLAAWDKNENNFIRRDTAMNKETEKSLGNPARIQVNDGHINKPMQGVALDDVLPERVDFIKIDVDGSEIKVLKGLTKTFERNPKLKMIIEYYPEYQEKLGNDPEEMMALLDKYFTHEKVGDYTDKYYNLICTRK